MTHLHGVIVLAESRQLPGAGLVGYNLAKAIPLYSQVSVVLAGFSVALAGIFSQGARREKGRSTTPATSALAVLLPSIGVLIFASYLYSEAAGSINPAQRLYQGEVASEALALGALLTIVAFVLYVNDLSKSIKTGAYGLVAVVALTTTAIMWLGSETVNGLLYREFWPSRIWLQLATYAAALVFAAFVAIRKPRWTKNESVIGVLGAVLLAIVVVGGLGFTFGFANSNNFAANLKDAKTMNSLLEWGRAISWSFVLLYVAFALSLGGERKQSSTNTHHKDDSIERASVPDGG